MTKYLHVISKLETAAKRLSSKVALQDETAQLSYLEIEDATNRLANLLTSKGIKPGDGVALYFEQSVQCVISIIATLKAGCYFIPLDIEDPEARVKSIIADAKPSVIIGLESDADNIRKSCDENILFLAYELAENQPSNFQPMILHEDKLAYVFFTSGSTGKPKGVCHSRKNLDHFVSNL